MPIRPENRARYPKNWREISQRIRWLLVGLNVDLVGSALILRAVVDDTRTWGAAVVFYGVFAVIGAIILAVGELVLPRERAKAQEGP